MPPGRAACATSTRRRSTATSWPSARSGTSPLVAARRAACADPAHAARPAAATAAAARHGRRSRDFRPAAAVERLHRSLANLRTDYVDILYLHEPALELIDDPEGLVRTLERFKSEGKARLVGLSGGVADCVRIAGSIPALGEVLQVEAGPASDGAATVRAAGYRASVTFGHFRASVTPAAPSGRAALLRSRLVAAAADNPDGVILFSARRAERIDEVAGAMEAIDAAR